MVEKKFREYKSKCDARSHELISELEKINGSIIDINKSKFEIDDDFIRFGIRRKSDKSYPIHLEIGRNKSEGKFFLWFGFNDNALVEVYYEDLGDRDLIDFSKDLMYNFLRSKITVKNTLVNDEIVKIKVAGDKLKDKDGSPITFGIRNKIIWPWQKPEVQEQYYMPWID